MLQVRYNDGYFNFAPSNPTGTPGWGYPKEFLNMIGYDDFFFMSRIVEPSAILYA